MAEWAPNPIFRVLTRNQPKNGFLKENEKSNNFNHFWWFSKLHSTFIELHYEKSSNMSKNWQKKLVTSLMHNGWPLTILWSYKYKYKYISTFYICIELYKIEIPIVFIFHYRSFALKIKVTSIGIHFCVQFFKTFLKQKVKKNFFCELKL